jgi:hypothetical protein
MAENTNKNRARSVQKTRAPTRFGPQNRPTLRLKDSPVIQQLSQEILAKVANITPLPG